jgi:CDP-glucose 4,6-dehydratase
VVLHLAAQPLVRVGYREPKATWDTNVSGTVNVLEAVRATPSVRACVVVTSDKCYENLEVPRGYRESDALGGGDPYSSSKAACELVVASWRRSFFSEHSACRLASARAGNVIGGGDWAPDRLVADCAAAMRAGRPLRLRSQRATRPWQHVLEPLSGYLDLAGRLLGTDGPAWGEAWNFGPTDASVTTVEALARKLVSAWGRGVIEVDGSGGHPHEAGILQLDSAKAQARLGWRGAWDLDTAVMRTVEWYRAHAQGDSDLGNLTRVQIATYVSDAREAGLPWTQRGAP